MLYFSAHWCPPCRGFTPKLGEWYTNNKGKLAGSDKQFELAFVSSDRDEAAFKSYWKEQADWLALPYEDRATKSEISEMFEVQGIPSLVVVDLATGKTVTTSARGNVDSDPDAADFPWYEKPCDYLSGSNISNVNEFPMLIAFADADKGPACLEAMLPAAKGVFAKADETGEDHAMKFAVEKGDSGFAERLMSTLGIKKGEDTVVIFDLESRKGFIADFGIDSIDADKVQKFVNDYLNEDAREKLKSNDMSL